ncbi:hypothetical protein ACFQ78_33900 [Streptomyces sp. NPDC056519]|uniref:hypothetical protein n=1 Tax=Streptomyces sp. NPDC056519 TaxID=3345849 RepID=UPI0036B10D2D
MTGRNIGRARAARRFRLGTMLMGATLASGLVMTPSAGAQVAAGAESPKPPPGGTLQLAYVVNTSSDNVSVIDTATNTVSTTIPLGNGAGPTSVAVTPDGSSAYVADFQANNVSVIDTATNTVSSTIGTGAGTGPAGVAVTPDGTKAFVADSLSDGVSVIDTATNTIVATIPVPSGSAPFQPVVAPDGSRVFVSLRSGGTQGDVAVIDTGTNTLVDVIGAVTAAYGLAVSPDGSRLYVAGFTDQSNDVFVVDAVTGIVLTTIDTGANTQPFGVAAAPNGGHVYVALSGNGAGQESVSVIDTATNSVSATVGVGEAPLGLAVTPDSGRVYVANSASDNVSVIDTATNSVTTTVGVGQGPAGVAITTVDASATPPPGSRATVSSARPVKVHARPERQSAVIGALKPGASITIACRIVHNARATGGNNTWYKLNERPRGWVEARHIKVLSQPVPPCSGR